MKALLSDLSLDMSDPVISPAERYERGLALKQAGLHRAAIEQLEMAALEPSFTLKAYAQMGLCYKLSARYEEAVPAFQKALNVTTASSKETVQILYLLGRTLESLGRVAEALESYRWIRREDQDYRDVTERIERLSCHRQTVVAQKRLAEE